MKWKGYNQVVQGWISQVEKYHGKEAEQTLNYAEKIKKFGESAGDDALLGFSYYYIGETYYILNELETFFQYIMQGMEYLQRSGQWRLAAKACNLLGITSNNQGNATFALDYYLSGVSICEKQGLLLERAILEYNIGAIYVSYCEYNRAIHYFESSWNRFQTLDEIEGLASYKSVVSISLASCYMELFDLDRAEHCLSQIKKEGDGKLKDTDELYFLCIQAKYYNILPNVELRDKNIEEIEKRLDSHVPVLEIFDDFYNYCQMLLEIDKLKEFWKILEVLEAAVKPTKLANLQRKLLNLKLEYYKKMGDNSGFLQAAGLYYELSRLKEKGEKIVIGSMLDVRCSLEEARKKQSQVEAENQMLQYQSETDSLTGIANRMRLNREAEEAFERAVCAKRYLAVEMLDVDYFKEYNDNYGHQQGDQCLIAIAQEIRKLTEYGSIFCARYGGDEFVLIYEGYSPERVNSLSQELKENISSLKLEHKFSRVAPVVTISQGICCDIPRREDKVWDFLHSADVMLYQIKRSNRNGISMGLCQREKAAESLQQGQARI